MSGILSAVDGATARLAGILKSMSSVHSIYRLDFHDLVEEYEGRYRDSLGKAAALGVMDPP